MWNKAVSLTGTDCGLEKSVNRRSLVEKFNAEVLHSTASTWKYSSTEKVKAVFGWEKEAGKSWCWKSWVAWSGAFLQQHQLTMSWWTLETSIITKVLVSLGSHASSNTSSTLSSSASSSIQGFPVLEIVFDGQGNPPWPRWSLKPSVCNEVFLKNSPVHFSMEWKGKEEWTSRQQEWQNRAWPKQSKHLKVPSSPAHLLQEWSTGSCSWFRYWWINFSLRGIQSERCLFWVYYLDD